MVTHFFNGIQRALETMGYLVDVLYCDSAETISEGYKELAPIEAYEHLFSFNGNGLGKISSSFNTLDFAKNKPAFVFCVDNPIHVLPRFFGHPVNILCVSKEHVSLMQQLGHSAYFFPHAVMDCEKIYPKTRYDRKYQEILFPISFMSSELLKNSLRPVWDQLGEAIEASTNVTDFLRVIGVVSTAFSPARTRFNENIRRIAVLVDQYLRARDRELCLLEFASRRTKLKVIGRDSQKFSKVTDYHQYYEAIDFTKLCKEISLSKWVLHQSPGFEEGIHERVIYPLVCGTPVMTFKSPYVNQAMRKKGVVDVTLTQHFEDEARYSQIIAEGKLEVQSHHTWTQRLSSLFSAPLENASLK